MKTKLILAAAVAAGCVCASVIAAEHDYYKYLQDNAKGRPHPNGGGFVADSARVAKTAYVGPNAMVLDGARVEDNACIKEFAIVLGPKTFISGNAKVGGRA